jgi:hypothetical protein
MFALLPETVQVGEYRKGEMFGSWSVERWFRQAVFRWAS